MIFTLQAVQKTLSDRQLQVQFLEVKICSILLIIQILQKKDQGLSPSPSPTLPALTYSFLFLMQFVSNWLSTGHEDGVRLQGGPGQDRTEQEYR